MILLFNICTPKFEFLPDLELYICNYRNYRYVTVYVNKSTEKVKEIGKSEPLLLVLSSKAENKANIALTSVTLYPTIFLLFQDYFYKISTM